MDALPPVRPGLVLCGQSPDGQPVEAVELREHPFCVGIQYHLQFKFRPNRSPLFLGFLRAALIRAGQYK